MIHISQNKLLQAEKKILDCVEGIPAIRVIYIL